MDLEQRKLKRRQLIYYLQVVDRNTRQPLGRLVDITTSGIMLISEMPFELNVVYKFKMILPPNFPADRYITFDAQSLWTAPDLNTDLFCTGFQFVKVSEKDIVMITDLIGEYELPQ